ncbi:MAG: flavodoxin family protein [Anaerolineae bacterium]|nr:flavodoxin family protein [Anaerolineae bacterium]
MKIAVVYHSESGNTAQVAQIVAEGARIDSSVEVRVMSIAESDQSFVKEAQAVIIGTPTYAGTFSWQMKQWLDTGCVRLADKLGAVFATENYVGGGADFAELALIGHLLVKGMIVYSAGASRGQPFTHYGAVTIRVGNEAQQERARIFGRRVAEKAVELFGAG